MRSRRIAVFAALLALVSMARADTRKELDAAYTKFNSFVKAKDLKGMMSFFTSDMTLVNEKGQISNRAAVESMLEAQLRYFKKVTTLTTKITKITNKDGKVLAETDGLLEALIALPGEEKTKKLRDASSTTDTWVKVKGAWKISKVVTTKRNLTVDGKRG